MNPALIGKQVGKFRITAALAEGGTLDVYKGVQVGLDREVVIKVLPPAFAADRILAGAFRRTLQRAARLSHPNIVALYDSGHAHGVDYFVTEFLRGESLEERIASEGPLDVGRALVILSDVLKALIYAHEKGEVHGDLKPSRVRFDHRGNAIVTGFGRIVREEAPGGGGEESPTVWADLHQVGVILYWMLSGHEPVAPATRVALSSTLLETAVPTLEQLGVDVPEELSRYLAQVLDPDPGSRPLDAAQMLQNLRRIDLRHRARKLCAGEALQVDAGMSKGVPGILPSRGTKRTRRATPGGASVASLDSIASSALPLRRLLPRRTTLLKGGLTVAPPAICALILVLWTMAGIDFSGIQLREKVIELEAHRALVAFRSSRECYSSVEFWLKFNPQIKHRTRLSVESRSEHEQALPDLEPGSDYCCRIVFATTPDTDGELTLSPVFEFRTPVASR